MDGRYYASETVSGLRLRLTDEATGAPVKLTEPDDGHPTTRSATRAARRSTPSRSTGPAATGWPQTWPSGRSEPKAVLAIEQGMLGEMFSLIFGTMAIAFAGLGIAGAIVLVVLWRRSKAVEPRRSQG